MSHLAYLLSNKGYEFNCVCNIVVIVVIVVFVFVVVIVAATALSFNAVMRKSSRTHVRGIPLEN